MPSSLPGAPSPVLPHLSLPAFLVSGERSACGKTTLTLALMAAFARRGMVVQGFKTGPDFIDTAWHSAATGRVSLNLDPWMHGSPEASPAQNATLHARQPHFLHSCAQPAHASITRSLREQFARGSHAADLAIMEGAMGLFDGLPHVPASSADVACLLHVPVLLALDCRGCSATAAAVALGLASFRPDLPLLGAVATFAGSKRHASLLRDAFARSSIPLLGIFPRDNALTLPSRHLGLFSAVEAMTPTLLDALGCAAEKYLDLDSILSLAQCAAVPLSPCPSPSLAHASPVRVAIARDEAFSFWYAEHDSMLADAGITLVPFSPLRDAGLPPDIKGLILPGGYPELHLRALSANVSMRKAVQHFPGIIYAECGGYIYLMESLECSGSTLPLCAALPLRARMEAQRVALGYREARALGGPWAGLTLRGHEFHYSRITHRPDALPSLWRCCAPGSTAYFEDGVALGHIFASYLHISLLSHPTAALRFADACRSPSCSGTLL